MTVFNSNLANAWTPEDYGKSIDLVVDAESIAFLVATVTNTDKHTIRFPILVDDAATGWVAEKATIPLTDPETGELVVTPTKVAGRVELSNESVMDSDPEVLDETAKGLGRSLAKRIDSAFFGDAITHGPSGLLSLTDAQVVDAGAFTNLDPFHDAKLEAFNNNAELTHFVLAPDVANTLAKVKTASGSTYTGFVGSYTPNLEVSGRELVLVPPLWSAAPGKPLEAVTAWSRIVLRGDEIAVLMVDYRPNPGAAAKRAAGE